MYNLIASHINQQGPLPWELVFAMMGIVPLLVGCYIATKDS